MEQFKEIEYDGVQITVGDQGTIYLNGKQKKWNKNHDGYAVCSLKTNRGWRSVGVHRLVAQAWVENPYNLSEVNHKDFNRWNPSWNNLEWMSHKKNLQYSRQHNRFPRLVGTSNPNYGNRKLSMKYKADTEFAKQKQGRPGVQNGRCVPVQVLNVNGQLVHEFAYIRECAKWLKDTLKLSCSMDYICECIRKHKQQCTFFHGYQFI